MGTEVEVITRNRTHRGYRDENGLVLTPEQCNIDSAKNVEIREVGERIGPPYCKRCFPTK